MNEQKRESLIRRATESPKAILKNMTKVMLARTDERSGCRNAPPKDLETPKKE
jgi:hypothetical protein